MSLYRRSLRPLLAVLPVFLLCSCATEAPRTAAPVNPSAWTNADWQTVLDQAVTSDGYVKYEVLKIDRSPSREALIRYVAQIAAVSPVNKPNLFPLPFDRLAYYINAYNALCMYGVLEKGPPDNLANARLDQTICTVGREPITPAAMEDQFIRPFHDPRVYFALNYMTRSSPPLRREAYDAAFIDGQLDDQAQRMLSDPRGAVLAGDMVKISHILTSHADDFVIPYQTKTGKTNATILDALRPYAIADSAIRHSLKFEPMEYDWSVNWAR